MKMDHKDFLPYIPNLGKLRERAGLKQDTLAEMLGVIQPTISKYEKNPADAPYLMVLMWVRACGEESSFLKIFAPEIYDLILNDEKVQELSKMVDPKVKELFSMFVGKKKW